MLTTDDKIRLIGRLYDDGCSLATIVREVGTDDETLRLIRDRLGVSMKTLRWHADDARGGK